jgi:hypothetical protein
MLLPRIVFLSVVSIGACALNGCSTIYADTFSNQRNRFVPPPPQRSVLPPDMQPAAADRQTGAGIVGGAGAAQVAPGFDGGAGGAGAPAGLPMIPGL